MSKSGSNSNARGTLSSDPSLKKGISEYDNSVSNDNIIDARGNTLKKVKNLPSGSQFSSVEGSNYDSILAEEIERKRKNLRSQSSHLVSNCSSEINKLMESIDTIKEDDLDNDQEEESIDVSDY